MKTFVNKPGALLRRAFRPQRYCRHFLQFGFVAVSMHATIASAIPEAYARTEMLLTICVGVKPGGKPAAICEAHAPSGPPISHVDVLVPRPQ